MRNALPFFKIVNPLGYTEGLTASFYYAPRIIGVGYKLYKLHM